MYHDIDLRRKPLFLVNAWNGLAAMDGVGSVSETLPWLLMLPRGELVASTEYCRYRFEKGSVKCRK